MARLDRALRCVGIVAAAAVTMGMLASCAKTEQAQAVVRPVRTIVVQPGAVTAAVDYPGEVRPRIESRLGFRVGGKIVERRVELGQVVKAGQVLARVDPQDLLLAEKAAKAQLDAANTDLALAQADFQRYRDLFQQNFIGKAELDRRQAALDAARARQEQAAAGQRSQANQAGYTTLAADADGVVTGIDAEVGQVVAAGTPVVRVARSKDKDVAIFVPENRVDVLRTAAAGQVTFWALPGRQVTAKVREIAAAADPATRTYAVRLALPDEAKDVRLGMTAVVSFAAAAGDAIRLPLSALVQREGKTMVWVVDDKTGTVRAAPVMLAGPSGVDVVVAQGLVPGQRVVTAGANLLEANQKVKLLETPAPMARAEANHGGTVQ